MKLNDVERGLQSLDDDEADMDEAREATYMPSPKTSPLQQRSERSARHTRGRCPSMLTEPPQQAVPVITVNMVRVQLGDRGDDEAADHDARSGDRHAASDNRGAATNN